MSKQNTSNRGSPQKHKGMKTSLVDDRPNFRQDNNIYTNPQRIYVQTINQQPNVMPYIDSQYTNQPNVVISQAQSQYVPINQRQNSFMRDSRPVLIPGYTRVSPLQGSNVNLSRTKIQSNTDQNRFYKAGSTFVPPPPQSFLINNTKINQQRSPSMGRTVIPTTIVNQNMPPTNFQSVKKTFVPHHIINEIPVYGGASVYAESSQRGQQSGGNDQSQQVLMGYYEKLYAKYEAEKQQSIMMRQQLNDALNQINYLKNHQAESKSVVYQNESKQRVIDVNRLKNLLLQKYNRQIDRIITQKKEQTIRQVNKLQLIIENYKVVGSLSTKINLGQYSSKVDYGQRDPLKGAYALK